METLKITGNEINISVNGTTICYDDLGKGTIPIIFIHGFPFDKSSWKLQMDFFKSSHRVIAYDIRGYGKSILGNQELSMSLFADDLIKFMDALEIDKAVVCGLSMGGYILLNAINRYPQRFSAVVLSDTQCIADSPEAKEKRNKSIAKINAGGLKEFAETFVQNIFCKQTLDNGSEEVERIKKIILSTSTKTIVSTLNALAHRWEMCSSLNEITVPTLILCGKEDAITPTAQSEFMNSKIAKSKLNIISGAGHMSNLENSHEFNKYVNDFISGLEK